MQGLVERVGAAMSRDPGATGTGPNAVLKGGSTSDKLSEFCGLGLHVVRTITSGGAGGGYDAEHFKNAQGFGFFSTFKVALILKLEHGSGFVVARTASGWSAPAFYKLDGAGVGINAGADDVDSLLVLHSDAAVDAFKRPDPARAVEFFVGGRPQAGVAGATADKHKEAWMKGGAPVVYELKSGFLVEAGAQSARVKVDEKTNRAFYGEGATPERILRGDVPPPAEFAALYAVLSSASA